MAILILLTIVHNTSANDGESTQTEKVVNSFDKPTVICMDPTCTKWDVKVAGEERAFYSCFDLSKALPPAPCSRRLFRTREIVPTLSMVKGMKLLPCTGYGAPAQERKSLFPTASRASSEEHY